MSNIEISKKLLEEFYINQNLSLNDVADYFGIHPTTVQKYLRKFGIRKSKQLIADLRKKTNIKKYGVENPSQRIEIKEKKKQTTLEHYAVENPFQSEAIKTKMKQTNLGKYGVENVGIFTVPIII